jgi:hypothetical protein
MGNRRVPTLNSVLPPAILACLLDSPRNHGRQIAEDAHTIVKGMSTDRSTL